MWESSLAVDVCVCVCECVCVLLLLKYLKQITQALKLDLEEEQQFVIVANTVQYITCVSEIRGEVGGKSKLPTRVL